MRRKSKSASKEDKKMSYIVESSTLEELTKKHQELYQKVQEDGENLSEVLREEVEFLLDEIKNRVKHNQVSSMDEYSRLSDLVHEWQSVFINTLHLPRDVHTEIGLAKVKIYNLDPSIPSIPEEKLKIYLEKKAYLIGQCRKLENLTKLILRSPHLIHQRMPSTLEEQEQDWHNANVYLASEVLEGKFNFVYQIEEQFYEILSQIWLDEVRQLKAYFIWQNKQLESDFIWQNQTEEWNPEEANRNYLNACHQIRDMLLSKSLKVTKNRFKKVRSYLESHYLCEGNKGKLDVDKANSQKLISSKAYRIWEISGKQLHESISWKLAEDYVRMFYESIIPIVMGEESELTVESLSSQILNLIAIFKDHNLGGGLYPLINCFEAALIIYFIEESRLQHLQDNLERLL